MIERSRVSEGGGAFQRVVRFNFIELAPSLLSLSLSLSP